MATKWKGQYDNYYYYTPITNNSCIVVLKLLAVPMETEVKVYESESWECVATLKHDCHKVVHVYIHNVYTLTLL